jgi:hypothetical protein
MGNTNPTFNFELEYASNTVDCKVVMQDDSYNIYFDDRFMGSIAYTEEWTWIQASGVIIPETVIEEIGLRVESEYK